MRIAVLGTGPVGQTVAARLDELGHEVTVGTRDLEATMARTKPDNFGRPPFPKWAKEHPQVEAATLVEAASGAAVVVNATNGSGAVEALEAAGADNLARKVLVDSANPLNFSQGMPPSLFVSGSDGDAKAEVTRLLQSLGWSDIVDLGDITTARGSEMYLPLWLRIMGATQNPMFNIKVVR